MGRSTAGLGNPEEISVGTGLSIAGSTLSLIDSVDNDTLASLSCLAGYMPLYNGTSWFCALVDSLASSNSVVRRTGAGDIESNGANFSSLKIRNGSNGVTLTSPAAANYPLVFPATSGFAFSTLVNDGTGNLAWQTAGDLRADGSIPLTAPLRLTSATSPTSPALGFVGSASTGIYSPAASQIGISTSGAPRVFIDEMGRVGIGTTNLSSVGSGSTILKMSATGTIKFDTASGGSVRYNNNNGVRDSGTCFNTASLPTPSTWVGITCPGVPAQSGGSENTLVTCSHYSSTAAVVGCRATTTASLIECTSPTSISAATRFVCQWTVVE